MFPMIWAHVCAMVVFVYKNYNTILLFLDIFKLVAGSSVVYDFAYSTGKCLQKSPIPDTLISISYH